MIHKNGGSKCMPVDEMEDYEYAYKIKWFEVSDYRGKKCIEFNL